MNAKQIKSLENKIAVNFGGGGGFNIATAILKRPLVCIDHESGDLTPDEIRMICHFQTWTAESHWGVAIAAMQIPEAEMANTIMLYKQECMWRWRHFTWTIGPFTAPIKGIESLLELIHGFIINYPGKTGDWNEDWKSDWMVFAGFNQLGASIGELRRRSRAGEIA